MPSTETEYKVTSFNSSGESADAPLIKHGPLMVEISGPNSVESGTPATFTANGKYGNPPYQTYYWYKRPFGGSWSYIGTGQSKNVTFNYIGNPMAQLKVTIEDYSLDYADGFKSVSIYSDCGDPQGPGELCKYRNTTLDLPEYYELNQNYPNPFNPNTKIKFALPEVSNVSIKIYNIMGQEVATLMNSNMSAGYHERNFDAGNLSSGMYIARFEAIGNSGFQFTKQIKMQLIK